MLFDIHCIKRQMNLRCILKMSKHLIIIVLERRLGFRERLFLYSFRSVVVTPSFLFRLPPLDRLVLQAGMVPAEDTPTLKSVRVSTLGCQSTVYNDVPGSWNLCYLYYLNGSLLVSRIRGLVYV